MTLRLGNFSVLRFLMVFRAVLIFEFVVEIVSGGMSTRPTERHSVSVVLFVMLSQAIVSF